MAAAVCPGGTLGNVGHDLVNLEHGYGGPQDPRLLYPPGDITGPLRDPELKKGRTGTTV